MDNELEIKDLSELNKTKKQQVIYTKDNISTDFITGEITERNQVIVKKVQTRESFIKLFVDNMNYLVNLGSQEKTLFFILLSSVDYKNVVKFDRSMRQNIILEKVLSKAGMYRALNGLIEKKIIFKVDREFVKSYAGVGSDECYLFNANVVGRGSWNDLRNLRHTVIREWDFEKMEVKQQLNVEEKYEGLLEVTNNMDKHSIEEVNHEVSNDGKFKQTNIVIAENDTREQPSLFDNDEVIDVAEEDKQHIQKSVNEDKDFTFMAQSFEITSKMLDRIKVLEEQGKGDEALALQKNMERYIENMSKMIIMKKL